ncbi:hypothetical protein Goari_021180, partial [Gossypium aridum]|nr:hypothetical protein [Gossypium aridum]
MCNLNEEWGLGFRSFEKFNVALLAKQGWRLINHPDSLVPQALKSKYYPRSDFYNASLRHEASYTWKSIWSAKKVLCNRIGLRVGTGDRILIVNHAWILGSADYKLSNEVGNDNYILVVDLIDSEIREWRRDCNLGTFSSVDVGRILRIPLACTTYADVMMWRGEPSGDFSMRRAYKLLQTEPVDREKQEVHERVSETSREIANSISCYIRKLEIKEERVVHSRSGSGIVVKNALGKVLVSRSILHVDVGTIFTAEALACLLAIQTGLEIGLTEA